MREQTNRTDNRNDHLAGGFAAEKAETSPAARSDLGGEGKAGELPKLDRHSFPARDAMPSAGELEAMQRKVDERKNS